MFLSRSSLSFFLITVALSTFAWLVRFSTRVADVPSIQKHTNKSLQTAHFTEPSSELQQMQYLRQMGELIYPETPPARSEKAAKTLHVAQREPGAEKQPGVTRFVCLSDTHGLHIDSHSGSQVLEVPAGDVLVFGGDAGIAADRHVKPFRRFLESQPHSKKVVTFGNMDHWVESPKYSPDAFPEADAVLLGDSSSARTIIDVQHAASGESASGESHTFRVTGSPYTPKFYGSFQLQDDKHAEEHWKAVLPPEVPVDILVTHGPPHGTGDLTRGRHVGDQKLLEAVQKLEHPPVLWVVGHIHNSYGTYKLIHQSTNKEIVVANVATNDLRSGKDTPPMIFDIKPHRMEVK